MFPDDLTIEGRPIRSVEVPTPEETEREIAQDMGADYLLVRTFLLFCNEGAITFDRELRLDCTEKKNYFCQEYFLPTSKSGDHCSAVSDFTLIYGILVLVWTGEDGEKRRKCKPDLMLIKEKQNLKE
ncbi:uncharacterized protein [Fopius arisanus]|uniref:Uncharacterized protein n=1 Tax=Fopius arisanus TaxID=64838 RepID=A0A9R1T8U5_9HYME|nr:PREDICTED: uncharacterized protein LOC105267521 [Fopius arisanus]